jgi:hypothetical protein
VNLTVWDRADLIRETQERIWLYLSQVSSIEQLILEAAALLQLPTQAIYRLAALQYLTSTELGRLLDDLPALMRRLATTTTAEEEWSTERIRGAIQWPTTIALRNATGMPHLYITHPTRRAYQTPENEMLKILLDEAARLGRASGWSGSTSEQVGKMIATRTATAERWRHNRMLSEVERRPITPPKLARIRSGRHRRRYDSALQAWAAYQNLVERLDRDAICQAIQDHAIIATDTPTLFEILCTFETIDCLDAAGWHVEPLHLFEGGLQLKAARHGEILELHYQGTPRPLGAGSLYMSTKRAHHLPGPGHRPDIVLRRRSLGTDQWLVIEVKGGKYEVARYAIAALQDLLAYRRSFEPALSQATRYGVGIAFGRELVPDLGAEVALCTPDVLPKALAPFIN